MANTQKEALEPSLSYMYVIPLSCHQYLFVSVKGSTRVGAASRDIGVGRRFRDLETQKTWLLSLKTIMSLGCRVLLFMK